MKRRRFTCLLLVFFLFLGALSACKRIEAVGSSYVEGKAECVMEVKSKRVLYERNGDVRLPMASTTKIATAITVLELCHDLQEKVEITTESVGIEGSSVYLQAGEIYTVEDLLYGLMLRSGNDCASALALHCCGSIAEFTSKMNEIAQKAGGLNTHFSNPHGLPCQNHYTTARDLSLITSYAMENPIFESIVSTKYYEPKNWKNKNKMLTIFDGGIGVKTGYTKEAGRCLVSAAKRGNMTLVTTVLNCPTTYERSSQLLEDAFSCYRMQILLSIEDTFIIKNGKEEIKAKSREDFYYPLSVGEENQVEIVILPISMKKNKEIVGQIQIYLSKRLLFSGNLYKL